MSATVFAEVFDPSMTRDQIDEAEIKPGKRVTRTLLRKEQTLDYDTFTKSQCNKCSYFYSTLDNNNKDIQCVYDYQRIENFILNISLPLPVAGSMEISSRKRRFGNKIFKFPDPVGEVEETVAGSTSEGLWLPQITHIKGKSYFTDTPDEDKKYIFSNLVVSSKWRNAFATIEPSPCSPKTFVILRYNQTFMLNRQISDSKILEPEMFVRRDGLIDRNKFVRQIKSVLKRHIRNYKKEENSFKCKGSVPKVSFSHHGPVITVEVEDEAMRQMISTDYVVCLPCPKWPEQAKDWITRSRVWPDMAVVKLVARKGCHIVPKPFKPGKLRETEFLFSFSICDKTLSQYLSLSQKRCYMLFKYIFKNYITKAHRGLTSYHCKNTFFWVCERRPSCDWKEDNVAECIKWLLDSLLTFLQNRNLPHYYIEANNLISEMSKDAIEACIRDVEAVIKSPAKTVLTISENHRLAFLSRDVSLQNLLLPLAESISATKILLCGYLLTFLSEMLDKGEIGLVIAILSQEWASDINVETSKVIKALEVIIANNKEETAGSSSEVDDRIVCLQGLLANLYHQKACENLESFGSYGSDIDKCLDTYHELFDYIGKHIWIYGACYDCMFQLEWFEEIIKHFVAKLNSRGTDTSNRLYEPGIYTVISAHNHLTTYPDELADMLKFLVIPSPPYILHKVAYTYMALSRKAKLVWLAKAYKSEADKVLMHLTKWVKRKCEVYPELDDDILQYLVGITAKEVGNAEVMKASFREAIQYGTTFRGFEIDIEPQFIEAVSQRSGNIATTHCRKTRQIHPYQRGISQQSMRKLPADMRFISSSMHVGPYIHG